MVNLSSDLLETSQNRNSIQHTTTGWSYEGTVEGKKLDVLHVPVMVLQLVPNVFQLAEDPGHHLSKGEPGSFMSITC